MLSPSCHGIIPTMTIFDSDICPHFGVCGGCSHQDISYDQQLRNKETTVRLTLGGVSVGTIVPIVPSPQLFFYRNKMEFSFGDSKDIAIIKSPKGTKTNLQDPVLLETNQVHLGLHPKGRFNVVTPTPDCRLLSKDSQRITQIISSWANEFRIPSYIRSKNVGDLRHVLIREGKNSGERLVALVANSTLQHTDSLADRLKNSGVDVTSFLWIAHDGLSDTVMGSIKTVFWGQPFIYENVGRIRVKVPYLSFFQTNTQACEQLLKFLDQWLQQDSCESLFDLYCGVGTLGLNLAHRVSHVIGIEIDSRAIEEAYQNARDNGILNTTFLAGRVEDLAPQLPLHADPRHSVLIVDPPRAGLHSRALESLIQMGFPTIYYVSCNPESLARDLARLSEKYDIRAVQPMDFFPHTNHVETLARLTAK